MSKRTACARSKKRALSGRSRHGVSRAGPDRARGFADRFRRRADWDRNYLSGEDRESAEFRARTIGALRAAVGGGINYFDSAQAYGEGRSERIIGEALSGSREKAILATKFIFHLDKPHDEYTRDLRQSLAHLQTDYVDVLQVHGNIWDDETAEKLLISGALDWANAMREKGLVRFVGITAEGPSGGLESLLKTGRFDVLEIAYSVIYQATCDYQRAPTGIIPLAKSLGIGVTVMRPTTCGVLQKLLRSAFSRTRCRANYGACH